MEGSNNLHCCGHYSYNILRSSCCNGNLTLGLSQFVTYCCGSVTYNPLNEICCNGSIFIRTSAHTKCCGKDPYQTTTHLCCGSTKLNKRKGNENDCCGETPFDNSNHCCCACSPELQIKPNSDPCCQTDKKLKSSQCTQASGLENSTTAHNKISGKCGSYDPQRYICCSGHLYNKSSELTKCCGKHLYSFSEGNVLCCNGILHRDMPEKAECVGGVVYSPENSTCHLPVRPQLGEHCCGSQTFDPLIHICCNGHRHYKQNGNICCGSKVFDPHNKSLRCCSDHLYSTSSGEVECCGNLLLEKKNQICCSSSTLAIKYVTKSNHHCCGHYYYNTSIWSCCAEHLKPTPERHIPLAEYRPKPLMELIPDICHKTVFLGKVESMTLNTSRRHVVLQVVWQVDLKLGNVIKDSWLHISVDHCSSPVFENGMIYLWEKKDNGYKPLSHPVDLASDIHMFYFLCYQLQVHKKG